MSGTLDAFTKTTGEGQPEETPAVADIIRLQNIPEVIKNDLLGRLQFGEDKYKNRLKVGWNKAMQELYQELLDAYNYAVSAQNEEMMNWILAMLRRFHA